MILKSLRYSHLTQVSLCLKLRFTVSCIQFFAAGLVIGAFRSEVDRRNEQVLGFTDLRMLFSHVMEEIYSPKNNTQEGNTKYYSLYFQGM